MIEFPRVQYAVTPPAWDAVRDTAEPVFFAPIGLRPVWRTAVRELLRTPGILADARRERIDARTLGRFLVWLQTARCFRIRSLLETDESAAALGRHLPRLVDDPSRQARSFTGLLITKNEEASVAEAIRSLTPLVDDLVVVDDESTDGTVQIATELGARVITRALNGDFAAQRNAGVATVRTEWVITIDGDEVVEPGLVPLLKWAASWPGADAVLIPRLNFITEQGPEPVFWPDMNVRMFRSHLRFQGVLHERVDGVRRPLFAPLSGPFVLHRKSLARQHRATLLYDAIDPNSPYPPDLIAQVREELARLESEQGP